MKIQGKKLKEKRKNRAKKKKSHFSLKSIFGYICYTLIFTIVLGPFTLLYGPFENAKKIYVGSAMATMSHQWLATMFLSDEKINEILGSDIEVFNDSSDVDEDEDLVEISENKDSSIELKQILDDNGKFTGYALIIKDPTRVKVGVSSKIFEAGESVSTIAENYDAVAAINGGYFTDEEGDEVWTSNGGIPSGFLMSEGEIIQDIDSDMETPILAITKEGKLLVGETTTAELLSEKEDDKDTVTEAMSYVTTLVKNGKAVNIADDEGSSPKTMMGQRSDGAIVLVVLDSALPGGRICATLKEAQNVMLDLDCYNAVNLDGGKSTTMYFNGEVINNPSYKLGERPISSGIIVKQ